MPPANAKKIRPPAPPPVHLKTRSATIAEIPQVPPKPVSARVVEDHIINVLSFLIVLA